MSDTKTTKKTITAIEFGQKYGFSKNNIFVLEKQYHRRGDVQEKTEAEWTEVLKKDFDFEVKK